MTARSTTLFYTLMAVLLALCGGAILWFYGRMQKWRFF